MRHDPIATRWERNDLLVLRHDEVIDRVPSTQIQRVILVCEHGDTPSDLSFALLECGADHVILPAESGIAGRVHFERQAFWRERDCIWWTTAARATLPRHLLPGVWLLRRHRPHYMRLPATELAAQIEQWPLEGPMTWEQRKWARIAASRTLQPARQRTPKQ
jgi:hypothetical protein